MLEDLQQYIKYKIVPPATLPKVHKAYVDHFSKIQKEGLKAQKSKIQTVLSKWKDRVNWWNQKFTARKSDILASADLPLSALRSMPRSAARALPGISEHKMSMSRVSAESAREEKDSTPKSLKKSKAKAKKDTSDNAESNEETADDEPSGVKDSIVIKQWVCLSSTFHLLLFPATCLIVALFSAFEGPEYSLLGCPQEGDEQTRSVRTVLEAKRTGKVQPALWLRSIIVSFRLLCVLYSNPNST